jgi:hypothetical protein
LCKSDIIGIQRAKELEEARWASRGEAGTEAVLALRNLDIAQSNFIPAPTTIEKLSSSGNPSSR